MESTRMIKLNMINKSSKNKKRLYRDILSSSENIKNIIKNRKKLYNQEHEIGNKPDIPNLNVILKKSPTETKKNENIIEKQKQKNVHFYFKEPEQGKKQIQEQGKKQIQEENCRQSKQTKKHKLDFFKPKFIQKYRNNKKIKEYFNTSTEIRIFTKTDIIRFIKTLFILSGKNHSIQVHRYIRKLNKYQTIQILFAVKIINNKSNAPEKMLKHILYNYFTSNITIEKN